MKTIKLTVEIEFEDEIKEAHEETIVDNVIEAVRSQVDHTEQGLAPTHTITKLVTVNSDHLTVEYDPKTGQVKTV